ncbi:MAG: two-component system, NtrC family, sensor kinase [Acidobacteriota bacterium]|jgi:signal transduction histidine kinase|nr:two-component system, NtrC family, sensor kinase [Acidobacteriota bacterium]
MLLALLLLSLFLIVLLGFYVVVAAPRSRSHQTFAAFVACLALWTIKDIALWGFYMRGGSASWWASASFIISLFLQYTLVVFACVFPDDKPVPWKRVATIFAPGAVLIPAVLAGWMWEDVGFAGLEFKITLTPLAYAFGLYAYGVMAYGFYLLYTKYRRYRSGLWGKQLGAILWALIITVSLNMLANNLLPLFKIYTFLKVGSIFVVPGVLVFAYAISNFKLFSLQSALDQFRLFPIAYKVALSIAVVAILSFLFLQIPIVWWSFSVGPNVDAWRRYLVFSVVTALVPNLILVALIIRTISRPVRRLTEAAVEVAGGAYGAQVALRSNDEMGLLASSFNEMSRKMAADIEHLRELNEQLIRTEKLAAAGTLAAGVAHEVNNPLASISSLIQILQTRHAEDKETSEMLRLISTQIARITQVLREMMDFARIRPPERAPLDIKRVIEACLHLANFDKAFQRLNISIHSATPLPLVLADANQLQQVILNLLLNARDAMPDGGDVIIRTRYEERAAEVVIEISDTGTGIAPEHRTHIFDPFFTTKPGGTGTGLGLAVCYGILTSHDGRIEISPNNGRGTCVRVILPASQESGVWSLESKTNSSPASEPGLQTPDSRLQS